LQVPVFDVDEGAGVGGFLHEWIDLVERVNFAVAVWDAAKPCVKSAANAVWHFFAKVAGEGVDLGTADEVGYIDDHADCGFYFIGVAVWGDWFARVGVDVDLDVVITKHVEDLAHEMTEAVEVINKEQVEFAAGGGFEELVERFDLFFCVIEGDVTGARFAWDYVFASVVPAFGRDELAPFFDLEFDADLIGGGLGVG